MNRLSHVLIVDDDEVSNFIVSQRLHEILVIDRLEIRKDGKSALEYLKGCKDNCPDLVILDLNLPLMNGFEFLEKLSGARQLQIPKFVILSSSDQKKDKAKALNFENVIAYIEKPLTEKNIIGFTSRLNLD